MKKWLYSVMVKVCVSFKNSLFVWVYLKVCFLGVVFTRFLFCKILAALNL